MSRKVAQGEVGGFGMAVSWAWLLKGFGLSLLLSTHRLKYTVF